MPTPTTDETRQEWLNRCMADPESNEDFPQRDQRFAFCQSRWEDHQQPKAGEEEREYLKRCFNSNPHLPKDQAVSKCKLQYMGESAKQRFFKATERRRERFDSFAESQLRKAFSETLTDFKRSTATARDIGAVIARVETALKIKFVESAIIEIWKRVAPNFSREAFLSVKSIHGPDRSKQTEEEADVLSQTFVQTAANEAGRQMSEVIKDMDAHSEKIVRQALNESISKGESIDEAKERITEAWSRATDVRATRIARTEIISASNYGSLAGARATGLDVLKVWLSSRDDRVRTSDFDHLSPDGQKRRLNEPFNISGQSLQYPGDRSFASAGNVINCRCTVIYDQNRT